jgi:uncharacterized protein (TIGR00255 family)
MLHSMTGYGSAEAAVGERKVAIEIRSVNHRFLDVSVRMPKAFLPIENEIKKLVGSYASRGKVDMTIQFAGQQNGNTNLQVDVSRAHHIYGLLQKLKDDILIPGDIDLAALLPFKDIFFLEGDEAITPEILWQALQPCLEQALRTMQVMQQTEGAVIAGDMRQRLAIIAGAVLDIELRAPVSLADRQKNLQERVRTLCNGVTVDEQRMLQEIALLSDRSDITEELVRAKSHLQQFGRWLDGPEPAGKKLDFLVQEINREVNTIGSKASDADISMKVVVIKNELEKIREQLQNAM